MHYWALVCLRVPLCCSCCLLYIKRTSLYEMTVIQYYNALVTYLSEVGTNQDDLKGSEFKGHHIREQHLNVKKLQMSLLIHWLLTSKKGFLLFQH